MSNLLWEEADAKELEKFLETGSGKRLLKAFKDFSQNLAMDVVQRPTEQDRNCGIAVGFEACVQRFEYLRDAKNFIVEGEEDGSLASLRERLSP